MLLLFDIDGTLLLGANAAHRDAIHEALRVVHGVTDPDRVGLQIAGRTDREIARGLLVAAGVSARRIDERADDVQIAACAAYGRLCPDDLSATVAPGMRELLARLAGRDDTILSLVTGNYEPIAHMKLAAAGIGGYFARGQGAFGSDHEDRSMLPAIARRRAGGAGGAPWPRERTLLIGDTPRDIACAHADGVRVIAIATGPFGVRELTSADAVARDARELGTLLDELAARPAADRG
ncbi:MAG TPA: haloacid dehalogenase-like hydrolase [Solirubrobacteraceae bacterium]|jgi:phosphoglycolate phosphatase-like HAD superfamily hydrolase|nr:haloacid dehalogenase-like hydrolase [Solirubrobacteraceae bacterium]